LVGGNGGDAGAAAAALGVPEEHQIVNMTF